jgi:hypothetical protein
MPSNAAPEDQEEHARQQEIRQTEKAIDQALPAGRASQQVAPQERLENRIIELDTKFTLQTSIIWLLGELRQIGRGAT